MGSFSNYVEYFRKIAEEHPDINGFYMMDVNELISGLRSTLKYPALILEPIYGRYNASNMDNVLELIEGGFLILDHLDNPDDFQGGIVLLDRMKEIGNQLIFRMLNDVMKCKPITESSIPGFDINSVSNETIGSVFANNFGIIFSFKIINLLEVPVIPNFL